MPTTTDHRLLVLGMLRMQDMHGYQIAEVIESHFDHSVHIKKATLYDTLRKLAEDGLVDSHEEQQGNRPVRTVYALTDAGAKEFDALLRESVATHDMPFSHGDAGLMFIDTVPDAQKVEMLTARRERMAMIAEGHAPGDDHGATMGLATERIARHIEAEIAWLDDVLARLG
jgi:DNA-binding PadR family transcriptional regulator